MYELDVLQTEGSYTLTSGSRDDSNASTVANSHTKKSTTTNRAPILDRALVVSKFESFCRIITGVLTALCKLITRVLTVLCKFLRKLITRALSALYKFFRMCITGAFSAICKFFGFISPVLSAISKFFYRFPCCQCIRTGRVEKEKIAVRKGFRAACLASLIHVIPVVASMALVVLNWRGYYIGGELQGAEGQDDVKFFFIQLAAKTHELFINASLTAVIFSYIRHKLTKESGLPFGAIVAGLQFKDISYLLSMEFWGAARASCIRGLHKFALVVLIIVFAGLALTVGPASATLIRPRLDYWPAGGTDFWIAVPPTELYSTNASATQVPASCMIDTGNLSCPSGGWQVLAQDYLSFYQSRRREGYLPDYTYVPGEKAILGIRMYTRSTEFQFDDQQTRATVGISSVADGLVETGRLWAWAARNWRDENFWSRIDAVYSVEAKQPIVHARCKEHDPSEYGSASTVAVYDLSYQDPHNLSNFSTVEYDYTNDGQVSSLVQNVLNGETAPQVAWSTVPQSNNGSALGVTLNVPMGGNNASMLFQCTIAARMAPGTLQSTRSNISLVTGSDNNSTYGDKNTFPQISIEPAWAAFLNPSISSDNSTAFQYMMRAAGILNDGFAVDNGSIVYALESLLSLSVVNGLARRKFTAGFSGTLLGNTDGLDLVSYRDLDVDEVGNNNFGCNEWCGHLMPTDFTMGYGGNAFNISGPEKAVSTNFTMRAGALGYAYNPRGISAKFAIFALLLYISIALVHLVYTLCSRKTSNSWGSILELVALAMRSDPSGSLENTGAGIDSDATFEEHTRIIDKAGRLQLAVGRPVLPYDRLEPNKEYK